MVILQSNAFLESYIASQRDAGRSVAFVPTMGALHDGHFALVEAAKAEADVVICSIFVNPTQFNEASDLEAYPRPIQDDIAGLLRHGCDALYLPTVDMVYPPDLNTRVRVKPGALVEVLEGAFRPGHFTGVMQVVQRLLKLVKPHLIVMGQKDYQQTRVIAYLLKKTRSKVRLLVVPTRRAADGLALSSRNQRLTSVDRAKAPAIYQTLQWCREQLLAGIAPHQVREEAEKRLVAAGLRPEYVSVADRESLQELDEFAEGGAVISVAAWAGTVRLIDNVVIEG